MVNARTDHYRKQAEDCRLQAERSKHIDPKESWMKLAAQWLHMAEEVDPAIRQPTQPPRPSDGIW
jgi:hypothetical protein